MPTVNLGRVRMVSRGAWSALDTYSVLDWVSHDGSSYVALGAVTAGTPVTDGASWALLAAKGDAGPAGASYVHDQAIPSAVWTINHGLGFFPSVFVTDTSDRECVGEVSHTTVNQTVITFSAGFAGKARLN